jgi:hypothetical protein
VRFLEDGNEPPGIDREIASGGRDGFVAKEILDATQITTTRHEVRREAAAQRVRRPDLW